MWRYTQLPSKIWSGVLILRRQGEGNRKWRKQFCFKIFDWCSEPPSSETSQSSQSQRTRDEARFIESHNVSFEEEGKMKTRLSSWRPSWSFGLTGRNRNSEGKSWNRGRRKKAGGGEGKFQEGVKSPIQLVWAGIVKHKCVVQEDLRGRCACLTWLSWLSWLI